jgi:decaprenyl-phosphate phosphoribosyltransferase
MPPRATGGAVTGLVRSMRPRQWVKNVLVLAAPIAAGRLTETWQTALVAMLAFVAGSAAIYLLNDTLDRHVDRANPRTATRPIASGRVRPAPALGVAALLGTGGLALMSTTTWPAVVVLALYLVLNVGYNLGLKHVALVELMIVASGYVLRAAVGGLATGVDLSAWFLSVASFAALFVIVVKRVSERDAVGHRAVMDEYPDGLLELVRGMALTATTLTYVLWAFDTGADQRGALYELSVAPFLLAILRYTLVTWDGDGASPEEVLVRDRFLQVVGLVWLVMLAVAING